MLFGGIVMIMEFRQRKVLFIRHRIVKAMLVATLCMTVTTALAETYRWKDKDGKIHYGAVVPAEYADQPYDILNNAGIVIEHVEDTTIPRDVIEEDNQKKKGRQPLISEEERKIQADKLLLVQYQSEEEITNALKLEIAQLGYDFRLIEQSYDSTTKAIRDQVKSAADRQRASLPVSQEQQKEIDSLYKRRAKDEKKRDAMKQREKRIRDRFERDLERYRMLTADKQEPGAETETEQG